MTRSELVLFSWTRSEIDGSCLFPWRTIILLYFQIRPRRSPRHTCTFVRTVRQSSLNSERMFHASYATWNPDLPRAISILPLSSFAATSFFPTIAVISNEGHEERAPLPKAGKGQKETRARKQKLRCAKGEEEGSPPRLRSVCSTNLTV